MRHWFLWGVLGLAGCGVKQDPDVATALNVANEAYAQAENANSALDDGTASGTTMGNELSEAQQKAHNAELAAEQAASDVQQALSRIDDLESRIDTICQRAPSACY